MSDDRRRVLRELRLRMLLREVASVRGKLARVLDDAESLGVADGVVRLRSEALDGELDGILRRVGRLRGGSGLA